MKAEFDIPVEEDDEMVGTPGADRGTLLNVTDLELKNFIIMILIIPLENQLVPVCCACESDSLV